MRTSCQLLSGVSVLSIQSATEQHYTQSEPADSSELPDDVAAAPPAQAGGKVAAGCLAEDHFEHYMQRVATVSPSPQLPFLPMLPPPDITAGQG